MRVMTEASTSVLVVDDNEEMLSVIARLLRSFGMAVTTTATSSGVSALVREQEPDVVLLDVNLPGMRGDALIPIVRQDAPEKTRFVLYSSCDEAELRRLAARSQADGWISKTAESADLARYLTSVVQKTKRAR